MLFLRRRIRQEYTLGLAELLDCVGAKLAMTVSAGLHTTKGHVNFSAGCRRIKIDQPRFDIAYGPECDAQVVGENRSREAIVSRIRDLYRLLVRGNGQDRDERTKDFFARDTHGWPHIAKNSRLVKGPAAMRF